LEGLRGKVLLDVNYDELVDISKPETVLEGVQQGINSRLSITDLAFVLPGYPIPLDDIDLEASMVDGRLSLDSLHVQTGDATMRFSGFVTNLPALLHKQDLPIEIGMEINANQLDLGSLSAFDTSVVKAIEEQIKSLATSFVFRGNAGDLVTFDYLPKGEFVLDSFYMRLKNYPHVFHDFDFHIEIGEENLALKNLRGEIDSTDFRLSGEVFNYPKWMRDTTDGSSRITLNLESEHFHPGDLLTYKGVKYLPSSYANEDIQQLKLQGEVALDYLSGELKAYDVMIEEATGLFTLHPLKLEGIQGRIHGEDGVLKTENLRLLMGESDFNLSMTYHHSSALAGRQNTISLKASRLNFDELSNFNSVQPDSASAMKDHEEAFNVFDLPFSNTNVIIEVGRLNYHKTLIENFNTTLRITEDHFIHVDTLSMDIADGKLGLTGYFNGSDPDQIYFAPNLMVNNLDLNQMLIKADNFGQEYVVNDHIKGSLSGSLSGTILLYPDLYPILDASELEMDIMIKNGVMVNYAPFQLLGDYFSDRNLNYVRFDTLQNTFTLRNNQLNIPAMTINSSLGFMEISGQQSLDMEMNYLLRIPWNVVTNAGVQKLFGKKNKEEVATDQVDKIIMRDTGKRVRFLNVRLNGTPDDYQISLGKGRSNQ
jgi:hypothetical protein